MPVHYAIRLVAKNVYFSVFQEKNIVKRFFDEKAHPERRFDSRLPLRASELPAPELTDIRRILPTEEECAANPRARSAILRVATRVRTGRPA